jgi:DNA-binding NarL/FixJ family response regulator
MTILKAKARILIVDDHPMMRDGLTMRISSQADMMVCGESATEDEAVERVKQLCPDLMLIDISLKGGNGIELIKRTRLINPAIRMLVVSTYQESLYAERVLSAGAMGYLNKQESNEKLIEAIRTVLRGERYVSAETTLRLVSQVLGNHPITDIPLDALTDRELEIFKLIGAGGSTSVIADQLFLSTHAIDSHLQNIRAKLGAKSASELTRQAIESMLNSG